MSEWILEIDDAYADDLIISEACTIKQPIVRCKDCIYVTQLSSDVFICSLLSNRAVVRPVRACSYCPSELNAKHPGRQEIRHTGMSVPFRGKMLSNV